MYCVQGPPWNWYVKNPNKKILKKKTQLTVMKNLPCMYTNADTLTNKAAKVLATHLLNE